MPSILNATTSSGLVTSADNSGSLQLATNNGTTAVTIDTSQNVGIGTTTPNTELHVQGTPTTDGSIVFNEQLTATTAFNASPQSGTMVSLKYNTGGDYAGLGGWSVIKENATDGNFAGAMLFHSRANGGAITERMRIDSTGSLIVGATATIAGEKLFVSGSVTDNIARMYSTGATPYGLVVRYTSTAPNNTGQEFLYCLDSTLRMSVRSNGGIANYSANNSNLSDAREKTNVELAGSYLDKICAIPVKTFNYIDQNLEEDDGLTLGVIAQDVQAVAPELVLESNWATKDEPEKMRLSIYQTDLQYALMKAIQELNAKVDAQALEIQALKGVA
jgi:hypothetical protein